MLLTIILKVFPSIDTPREKIQIAINSTVLHWAKKDFAFFYFPKLRLKWHENTVYEWNTVFTSVTHQCFTLLQTQWPSCENIYLINQHSSVHRIFTGYVNTLYPNDHLSHCAWVAATGKYKLLKLKLYLMGSFCLCLFA